MAILLLVLLRTPPATRALTRQLAELDELRKRLGDRAGVAGPWLGSLRRQWRASTAESSIEIEGFRVPAEETIAVASGEEPPDPRDEDRMALACYARAMDHVGVMLRRPDVPLGRSRHPRPPLRRVLFPERQGSRPVPPGRSRGDQSQRWAARVRRPLATTRFQSSCARSSNGSIAAIRTLTSPSVPPWPTSTSSRCTRSATATVGSRASYSRSCSPARACSQPEFVSIEEYLGRHTDAYYATLQKVQGGAVPA